MSSFAFLLLVAQACLFQVVFGQVGRGGAPNISPCASYSTSPAGAVGLGANLGYGPGLGGGGLGYGPGVASCPAWGGQGCGDVSAAGELAVSGNTLVAGQIPVLGQVCFAGTIPAAGAVTISGSCGCPCGCNSGIYY